jgi:hypothetical protein
VSSGSALSFVISLRMTFGAFIEAVRAFDAAGWEQSGAEGEWSPRQAAEHLVRSEVTFAGWVAGATGFEADLPAHVELPATDAAAIARHALERCGAVATRLENDDLGNPCPAYAALQARISASQGDPPGGWGPATIAGALALALSHADEHTRQLRQMAKR